MAGTKFSRQRQAIVDYLCNTKEHPTADVVYTHVKEIYPNVSLGTVYRNLSLLAEEGEILRLTCGDGSDHFDGTTTPHYHFICNECHSVWDIEMPSLDHIDILAGAGFTGTIEGHTLLFHGICPRCENRNNS